MKDFLKYTLASMVGFILANIILGIITMIIFLISIGSIMSMAEGFKGKEKVSVEEKSVLNLSLDYPIAERTSNDPFKQMEYALQDRPSPVAIRDVLKSIESAKNDDKIKGIFIETGIVRTNYANLEDIRKELKEFKESGKFIYSYSNIMTQKGYYLASLADSIFMQPEGMMQLTGMHSEMVFYKGLFDKLGITPYVFKAGKYKSAGESFTHKEMSKPNEKQIEALLGTIHTHYLNGISDSRGISQEKLQQLIDNFTIRTAEDALQNGLVDKLLYHDEMLGKLKKKVNQKEEKVNLVTVRKYKDAPAVQDDSDSENEIAIIYANGTIGMGEGDMDRIGSNRISKAIRKARKDEDIKSIVLRVNSPGGSALASDIIWREVKLASAEKPVVVSMGNVAASGGYYISAPADTIIAQPNTITGSIGVIGIALDWKKFWNDKLGITFDRVKTGRYADFANPNRPMTEGEKEIFRSFIDETYQDFIKHVAQGRGMDVSMVDSLGRGRVWSGQDAKEVGLVDMTGGFEKAIQTAADMANLDKYEIKPLPELEDPFKQFMESFTSSVTSNLFNSEIQQKLDQFDRMKLITKHGGGVYMLMPYDIEIE